MTIIFDLLKDLLIWAMTFVGEDGNEFRMIVGIYVMLRHMLTTTTTKKNVFTLTTILF
jgi:hypothetical protein